MANHGVVTFGSSLESAYMKMETVEHFAKIALVTHLLGQRAAAGRERSARNSTKYGTAITAEPVQLLRGGRCDFSIG